MKQFLKKRWHGIPVGIVSGVLALVLVAGGAFAAYNFAKVQVEVTVEEAIVLGYNWCGGVGGDDLAPYMVGGTVLPKITLGQGTGGYDLDVTIQADEGVDASEFCPGETLIIPLNLRNKSDGALTINVTHGTTTLDVGFDLDTTGTWNDSMDIAMLGHQGTFGSDMDCNGDQDSGATVLYIKVHAPGDCAPGTQTFRLDFSRS